MLVLLLDGDVLVSQVKVQGREQLTNPVHGPSGVNDAGKRVCIFKCMIAKPQALSTEFRGTTFSYHYHGSHILWEGQMIPCCSVCSTWCSSSHTDEGSVSCEGLGQGSSLLVAHG